MMQSKVIKRLLLLSTLLIAVILVTMLTSQPAQALPEYAVQMDDPCTTCHVSPSGGGTFTISGLAWLASDKSGAVPSRAKALELLGVNIQVNQKNYVAVPGKIPPVPPLQVKPVQARKIHAWLENYEGN
jgi:hypothetical protein